MLILAGDIGGTNARLALYEEGALRARCTVSTPDYNGLGPIVEGFLAAERARPDAVCVGVAGPVRSGRARLTNVVDWTLDADELSAQIGAPFRLINDFHAQALAMPRLGPDDYEELGGDLPVPGAPMVVIGAGTGLGEAFLVPGPQGWLVMAGEGSHARFAPRNEREVGLLRDLWRDWPDHVSVERVVSGPGLVRIYDHFRGTEPRPPALQVEDPAPGITARALAGECPHCVAALELFVEAYADEAANLALKCNAGVVWLTGGITPRILPFVRRLFRPAFVAKGRYGAWLETVPVRVVLHPDAGLLGALAGAEELLHGGVDAGAADS